MCKKRPTKKFKKGSKEAKLFMASLKKNGKKKK